MKKRILKIISLVLVFSLMFGNVAFATSGDIDPAIIAETKEVAVQIESEGIVLLKNEDNFLPLENKKVNIFGAGSVCPFFGGAGSDYKGIYVLTDTDNHKSTFMYCDLFDDRGTHYIDVNPSLRINVSTYTSVQSTLIAPHGIPFNDGFEIRMTQSSATTSINTHGFVVVYEIYE